MTATNTTHAGHVTVYPAGESRPLASSLNPQPGLTRANLTMVKVGARHAISLYNNTDATDLVVDLMGYFGPLGAPDGGAEYYPIGPERHYDTRDGTGGIGGPVGNATDIPARFAARGSFPADPALVSAVDANVTVTDPATDGHTTVWPAGPRPDASILNFLAHETVSNRDVITLSVGGAMLWSTPATIDYVIDVSGWFGPQLGPSPDRARTYPSVDRPTTTTSPTVSSARPTTTLDAPWHAPTDEPPPRATGTTRRTRANDRP